MDHRFNPEIVNSFTGEYPDYLVSDHFQQGKEGDDGMNSAFAVSKNVREIEPWFEY